MVRSLLRKLVKTTVVGAATALVVTWFRGREPEIVEHRTPGGAQWAPLEPLPTLVWAEPDPAGSCPLSHPVKVKIKSGIFHVSDGLAYERTKADRCYPTAEAAEADGFRASKM